MPRYALLFGLLPLTLPLYADSNKGRAAGAEVYKTFGCAQCHNPDLSGSEKGPDLRGVGRRLHQFDITQQVQKGGGGMPSFGDVIDEQQTIHLVEFLHAQTKGPKVRKRFKPLTEPDPQVQQKPTEDQQ